MVAETETNSHRGTLFYSFEVRKDDNLLSEFKRHYRYFGIYELDPLLFDIENLQFRTSLINFEIHSSRFIPFFYFSTESGWDNPFRPGGDLSREADEIVNMIKGKLCKNYYFAHSRRNIHRIPSKIRETPIQNDKTIKMMRLKMFRGFENQHLFSMNGWGAITKIIWMTFTINYTSFDMIAFYQLINRMRKRIHNWKNIFHLRWVTVQFTQRLYSDAACK